MKVAQPEAHKPAEPGPGARGAHFAPLLRRALIDRLLSNRSPLQVLMTAPGFGGTTLLRQTAEHWSRDGIARWLDCPRDDGAGGFAPVTDIGHDQLLCIDAPEGLSAKQMKEVAALLLREGRPRLMIATHDPTLVDQLPCEYAVFDSEALRFSDDETAALLSGRDDLAYEIVESAQGWPFAIDLMRRVPRPSRFHDSAQFAAELPPIGKYFADIVLPRLASDTLDVLLAVARLDSNFSADLVTCITQDPEAWRKLEPAIAAELFVSRLRDRSNIYRLHPFFGIFLREYAQAARRWDPDVVLRRASEWFCRQGRWDRAIHYAALAHDSLGIISIAQQAGGWKMLGGGGLQSVGEALDVLPERAMLADPQVRALRTVSALKAGRERQDAEDVEDKLLHALVNFYQDKPSPGGVPYLWGLREEAGASDCVAYGVLSSLICLSHLDQGAPGPCDVEAQRAIEVLLAADHPAGTAYLHTFRARADTLRGDLDSADAHVGRVFAIAWEPLVEVEPLARLACVHAAAIALERGELERGRRLMAQGWPFLSSFDGWYDVLAEAMASSVRLSLARGDAAEALRSLASGDAIADRRSLPRLTEVIANWRLVAAVTSGEQETIVRLRRRLEAARGAKDAEFGGHYLTEARAFAEAAYALWRGAPDVGLRVMLDEAERAHALGALPLRRRAQMWAALAALRCGRQAMAEDLANAALVGLPSLQALNAILPPCGDLRPLLRDMALGGRIADPDAAQRLRDPSGAAPDAGREWLSAREEEILDLVGAGMTNKEIARRLAISDSTVKFHRKNIYTKLGVSRRSRALEILSHHRAQDRARGGAASPV